MRYKQAWPGQRARSRPVWVVGRLERPAERGHTGPYGHLHCDCSLNAMRRVLQRQVRGSHVHMERTPQNAKEHGMEPGEGGRETKEPLYQCRQEDGGLTSGCGGGGVEGSGIPLGGSANMSSPQTPRGNAGREQELVTSGLATGYFIPASPMLLTCPHQTRPPSPQLSRCNFIPGPLRDALLHRQGPCPWARS